MVRSGTTMALRVAARQYRRYAQRHQPPPLAPNAGRQAHPVSHSHAEPPHGTAPAAALPAGAPGANDPHRGTIMALLAAVRGHPVSAAACILGILSLTLTVAHILTLTTAATAGGVLYFAVGEHVANPDVVFGSMPIADFLAGCTSFNLTDSGLTSLQRYPTLNCLRTMGPEDAEGNKTPTTWEAWESFCTEHRLPDTFKEAAAEHVVVELAVNNFFKWREVEEDGILTWAQLEARDRRAAARQNPSLKRPDTHRTQRALRLLQGDIVH
eukprot:Rhum_TRINITY_DN14868_c0_g1::Rhum_TRINITY_DN14868_c0_g1_i2::g.125156::m.125156